MQPASAPAHYTAEEYLALDRAADYRSEFRDGEIVAMAGGSRLRSLISRRRDTLTLESVGCSVLLSEVYRRIEAPDSDESHSE